MIPERNPLVLLCCAKCLATWIYCYKIPFVKRCDCPSITLNLVPSPAGWDRFWPKRYEMPWSGRLASRTLETHTVFLPGDPHQKPGEPSGAAGSSLGSSGALHRLNSNSSYCGSIELHTDNFTAVFRFASSWIRSEQKINSQKFSRFVVLYFGH